MSLMPSQVAFSEKADEIQSGSGSEVGHRTLIGVTSIVGSVGAPVILRGGCEVGRPIVATARGNRRFVPRAVVARKDSGRMPAHGRSLSPE